jgi:hypothetical protein
MFCPYWELHRIRRSALVQTAEASLFDSGNMDKHVLSTSAFGLNKSVPFLRIEPLHGAARHFQTSKLTIDDGVVKSVRPIPAPRLTT